MWWCLVGIQINNIGQELSPELVHSQHPIKSTLLSTINGYSFGGRGLFWVFFALHWLSLVAVSGDYSLLGCTGSRYAGFSSCRSQT